MNKKLQLLQTYILSFKNAVSMLQKILSEYDCDFEESRFNNWELDYDDCHAVNKFDCYTEVDIYAYGCHVDSRSLHFPIELL